jgi:hypothetical protein
LWGDPNNTETNPHYLGDALRGAGTENISVGELTAGWNYRLALKAWGENPNQAWLRVYHQGRAVFESEALRIAPEEPNSWLYLGRLDREGYTPVLQMSEAPPRN